MLLMMMIIIIILAILSVLYFWPKFDSKTTTMTMMIITPFWSMVNAKRFLFFYLRIGFRFIWSFYFFVCLVFVDLFFCLFFVWNMMIWMPNWKRLVSIISLFFSHCWQVIQSSIHLINQTNFFSLILLLVMAKNNKQIVFEWINLNLSKHTHKMHR